MGVTSDKRGRWQAHGERAIYDSPWVWLGQVDVEPPGGARYWHHVVRLRKAAVAALLDDQDRVLMLWRHRFVPDRWGWELPGGLVDEGEEPAAAANRELVEETGYRAGHLDHLVTFQPMPGTIDAEHYVYTGRDPLGGRRSHRPDRSRPGRMGAAGVGSRADRGRRDLDRRVGGGAAVAAHGARVGEIPALIRGKH